jgi:uncharacterized protein (TIGR00369 family)
MNELEKIRSNRLPFAERLGIRCISASPEVIVAEMTVKKELCTSPEILHGGAMMSFADTLGAWATFINLKDGQNTTTLESKTNFLAPAPLGTTIRGECAAIHRGRRTMVWQTRITSAEGRLLAIVTQTQMVLEARS